MREVYFPHFLYNVVIARPTTYHRSQRPWISQKSFHHVLDSNNYYSIIITVPNEISIRYIVLRWNISIPAIITWVGTFGCVLLLSPWLFPGFTGFTGFSS